MNKKNVKAAKPGAGAEDAALNRVLCWLAGGALLEFLVMFLNRYWVHYGPEDINFRLALGKIVPVFGFLAAAGAVIGVLWWGRAQRAGKSCNLPGMVTLVCAGVAAVCLSTWLLTSSTIVIMSRLVPVVVVLALIYYLYQREFFFIALEGALAMVGVWLCSRGLDSRLGAICWLYVIAAALAVLAAVCLCVKLQKGCGKLELADRKLRILPKNANYYFLYGGAAVSLFVLVCALLPMVPVMFLYAVLVSWLLVMAVCYTVKMM